jgi:hypothetical protein
MEQRMRRDQAGQPLDRWIGGQGRRRERRGLAFIVRDTGQKRNLVGKRLSLLGEVPEYCSTVQSSLLRSSRRIHSEDV